MTLYSKSNKINFNRSIGIVMIRFLLALQVVTFSFCLAANEYSGDSSVNDELEDALNEADFIYVSKAIDTMALNGIEYRPEKIEILDFFVRAGDYRGVSILVESGLEPDSGRMPSVTYLLSSISDWDSGFNNMASSRVDFLRILSLLIRYGSSYDFEMSDSHFVESLATYYCSSGYERYGVDEILELRDSFDKVYSSKLKNISKILSAAKHGAFDFKCVLDLKRKFVTE